MAELAPTLVVFAHPALERARVSPVLTAAAREVPGAAVRDLYELYPDFTIDVAEEQAALHAHQVVVLQFPLYWYSAPSLLKEWIDMVWTRGFAYGGPACALAGKTLTCAVTTGGDRPTSQSALCEDVGLAELMRPFQQAARLCAMRWVPPFAVDGDRAADEAALAHQARRYQRHLRKLAAEAAAGAEAG